jgi:hypothetical protein
MPWLKFILPTAKERPMSVGLEEGGRQEVPAWFDVSSLGELMWTSRDADARQDEEALRNSFFDIQGLIQVLIIYEATMSLNLALV